MELGEATPEWAHWQREAQGTWLLLHDGAWINMGAAVAVRPQPDGRLQLEFLGQRGVDPEVPLAVGDAGDLALVRAYLATVRFLPAGGEPDGAPPPGASDVAAMSQPDDPLGPSS